MILWINGAFGSGKTTTAYSLHRRLENSFVYDPEQVGYTIRKLQPKTLHTGDFQHEPLWREWNVRLLSDLSSRFDGYIIVPQTLVRAQYYQDIIGALRAMGIPVRHVVLSASKDELLRRLRGRGDGKNSWAARQIDERIKTFQDPIFENPLETDGMSTDQILDKIAALFTLALLPDRRSALRRFIDHKFFKHGIFDDACFIIKPKRLSAPVFFIDCPFD